MWYLALGAAALSYFALIVFAARSYGLRSNLSGSTIAGFGFPLILADEQYPTSFCKSYWLVYVLILCVTTAAYYLFPALFPKLSFALFAIMLLWLLFFTTSIYRTVKHVYKGIPADVRSNASAVVSLAAIPHKYFAFEIILYIVILLIMKAK